MYRAHADAPAIPAWLVCDRAFIRRYGLGLIRPRTPSLRRHVASGYLREGESLAALARQIGVPAAAPATTAQRFHGFAAAGCARAFGQGRNPSDPGPGPPPEPPNPP